MGERAQNALGRGGDRGVCLPVGATCTQGSRLFTGRVKPYAALNWSFKNSLEGSDAVFTVHLHWPMGWKKEHQAKQLFMSCRQNTGWVD